MNIKISLFIFTVDNFFTMSSIEIVNSYINSHNKKKEDEENYALTESFKESLFILNKIDLIEPKEKKKVEEDFKKYIEENCKNKIYIKLNEENEIAINARELNRMNSFENYLKFYNYKYGFSYNEDDEVDEVDDEDDDEDYYYKYIIKNMNKDFNLNIKKEINYENNIKEFENKEYIFKNFENDEEIEKYKNLKHNFEIYANFNSFISLEKYLKLKKIFIENKNNNKNEAEILITNLIKNKIEKIMFNYYNITNFDNIFNYTKKNY